MWDAKIELGDNVLIIGYGIVGALVALLVLQIPGVKLTILELNHVRSSKASEIGVPVVTSNDELECEFDIAFNTSASSLGLQVAIDKTITDGKIIIYSCQLWIRYILL